MLPAARCSARPRRQVLVNWPPPPSSKLSTSCLCSARARPTMLQRRRWQRKLERARSWKWRDRGSPTRFRSTDASRPGVVLLHGIARTSGSLRRLERALQESGFATLNLDYQSRKKPLDALAADIHPAIIDFAETNNGPLHFVAHSMGGLLTRVYVAKYRPAQPAHVVMLGTPNGGSEVADLLKGLSIFPAFYGPSALPLSTQPAITLPTLPPPAF